MMIALRYNFKHPFQDNVILRKIDIAQGGCQTMPFDSGGEHDFDIYLQVKEDGTYKVILNWEFEGRSFSHESQITVKNGQRIL